MKNEKRKIKKYFKFETDMFSKNYVYYYFFKFRLIEEILNLIISFNTIKHTTMISFKFLITSCFIPSIC